jgi:hypothetical protein
MNLIATDHQMMTLGNRLIYLDYKYQLNLGCYIECQSFLRCEKGLWLEARIDTRQTAFSARLTFTTSSFSLT